MQEEVTMRIFQQWLQKKVLSQKKVFNSGHVSQNAASCVLVFALPWMEPKPLSCSFLT